MLISGDRQVGLSQQLDEALAFLNLHALELQAIKNVGVDNMLLDLGMEVGNKLPQAEYVPPELIAALGRLGMGVIFSIVTLTLRHTLPSGGGWWNEKRISLAVSAQTSSSGEKATAPRVCQLL